MSSSPLKWKTSRLPRQTSARTFLPLLRAAVAANPERCDLRRDMVVALRDDRRWREIVDMLGPLERTAALSAELALELGMAAAQCEAWEEAKAALDIAIAGRVPGARRQMAFVLDGLGRTSQALETALAVLAENPRDADTLEVVGRLLLEREDGDGLLALCDDLWRQGGGSAILLAWRGVALAATRRESAVSALVDYDAWCAHASLPPGAVDNDRLAETVLNHPDLAISATYKATRGRNLRLDALADRQEPAIESLLGLIRERVDAYVAARAHLDHPVMAMKPDAARLQGWALVVMEDGHEVMHIHPGGWLTAVYYVRTPEGAAEDSGSIVFGAWPPGWEARLPGYPCRRFRPRAGDLLIFPSFMGHRTIPTGVADTRLCMVLDIAPCARST